MKKSRIFLSGIFIITICISIVPLAYATTYDVVDLGFNCFATGLNDYGQVVGYRNSTSQAFIWDNGSVTDLGTLPGLSDSFAMDVNNYGQVTGDSEGVGFIWDSTSGMSSLGFLPGGIDTYPYSINNSGQIVGFGSGTDFVIHAFLWEESVGMTDLGPVDSFISFANDINDSGQVVGSMDFGSDYSSFLWEGGSMINIGIEVKSYFGGDYNEALAINSMEQVVGEAENPADERCAFLWDDGVVTELAGLLSEEESGARDINDSGQIVGYSKDSESNYSAVLWENDEIIDLNDYMPPEYSDWTLGEAAKINNNGQILALGNNASGDYRGFLFTPEGNGGVIPEPASLLLLGFGVVGIALFRRKLI